VTILEPCGCFSDDEMNFSWPCSLHRGQTEEQRQADEQQQIEEAEAMNEW